MRSETRPNAKPENVSKHLTQTNMRQLFLILFTILNFLAVKGQEKKSYNINFTDPKSVVNAIFYAAQTKDFTILQCLCDPFGQGDGDTKRLCSISEIAKQIDSYGGNENTKKGLEEFVKSFEGGRTTGQVTFDKGEDGTEYASVPFWFNSGAGEDSNNETMKLVKRHGNWYLGSF